MAPTSVRTALFWAGVTPEMVMVSGCAGSVLATLAPVTPAAGSAASRPLDVTVRWRGGDSFLHVDGEHEVSAALEIESEVDAVGERLLKAVGGDADDAVDEEQQNDDDDCQFRAQLIAHDRW